MNIGNLQAKWSLLLNFPMGVVPIKTVGMTGVVVLELLSAMRMKCEFVYVFFLQGILMISYCS